MSSVVKTKRPRFSGLVLGVTGMLAPVVACSSGDGEPVATGGMAHVGTGGMSSGGVGTGGLLPSGGSNPGTGGVQNTGGVPSSGGVPAGSGGGPGAGGGGTDGSGGTATGGADSGTGGAEATGGAPGIDVDKYFKDWPEGADPLTVGKRLAEVFLAQNLPTGSGDDPNDDYKHYKDACAWYGALSIAGLVDDAALTSGLIAKYEPYKNTWSGFSPPNNNYDGHVDNNVFGIVPLEIAKVDPDPIYLTEGDLLADHQVEQIAAQIRFAIDDMFMITSLQVQAYRVLPSGTAEEQSHRNRHLDTAAETMVTYLETMQEDNGLFPHHRDNAAFRISWGRGNGWYAAGMAEMIRELPLDHPEHGGINEGYMKMMNGLLQYQIREGQAGAGLWKQVVDSDDERNWAETSGSAMFAYALVSGVRRGWLDVETFGPAARSAWLGLVAKVNAQGQIQDTSNWAYLPSSHEGGPSFSGDEENYYFQRERLTGDNHGQAPVMWTAAALARPL